MKTVITAFAHKRGNRVELDDEAGYRRDVALLSAKDGAALIVKVTRATRSDKANAYYWSTVLKAIEEQSESGNSDVELHDAFCEMFLPTQAKQVAFFSKLTGEVLSVSTDAKRSSVLSGAPFYDFVEKVREFARHFWGIDTPDPDSEYWRREDATVIDTHGAISPN